MRKDIKRGIGILLSLGIALSGLTTPGEAGRSVPVCALAAETETETEEMTDETTGYQYVLYEETEESNSDTPVAVKKVSVTGYTGTETELKIPSSIAGYPVGEIGDEAFKGNENITAVIIPEGVKTMGMECFYGCTHLKKATLPSTIREFHVSAESIGTHNNAFEGCTALTELILSEGMTCIGPGAFMGCTALECVKIPSTIGQGDSYWAGWTFAGCTSLKNVELSEGMTIIGFQDFAGCVSLQNIHIPSTITTWCTLKRDRAVTNEHCRVFEGCTALESVTFEEGLTTLYRFAGFSDCPKLKEITVPSTVKNVYAAFMDCEYLERITFEEDADGNGIEEIGEFAFNGCIRLKRLDFPSSLKKMYSAFSANDSLESLVLPEQTSEFTINGTKCTGLKNLYIASENLSHYSSVSVAEGGKIYCVPGSETYQKLEGQGNVLPWPETDVTVTPYQDVWDGKEHDMVTLENLQEGDEVSFRLGEGEWEKEIPKITEVGSCSLEVKVKRIGDDTLPFYLTDVIVQPQIQKRTTQIQLADMEICENQDYTITPVVLVGDGEVEYIYYRDSDLKKKCSTKPSTPGTYYVKAVMQEGETYYGCESNVAKLVILKKSITSSGGNNSGGSSTPGSGGGRKNKVIPAKKAVVKKVAYRVLGKSAVVSGVSSKSVKSITIQNTVKIGEKKYQVTGIAANAFKNCRKLKKITIKASGLKKIGKNAIKGIYKKAVFKVPKKKYRAYKKLIMKKKNGYKKTMKVKK